MGFPSLAEVVDAAKSLTYTQSGQVARRTDGFWHVLIFLRHRRLAGSQTIYTLESYDLAEACFDVLGVLPRESASVASDVYYEPAAKSAMRGTSPSAFFRTIESPRNTFLNRIQTGLSGEGPRQPNYFDLTSKQIPVKVSLRPDWVAELRSKEPHVEILDSLTHELATWLFRFGIPRKAGTTESISLAQHLGIGRLRPRANLSLVPLPNMQAELAEAVQDFLGLSKTEFASLFPEYDSALWPSIVLPGRWTANRPVVFQELDVALHSAFASPAEDTVEDELGGAPSQEDEILLDGEGDDNSIIDWNEVSAEGEGGVIPFDTQVEDTYSIDWNGLTADVVANPPLTGVESAVKRAIAALRAGKFVILLGVPGSGKTSLAVAICEAAQRHGLPGHSVVTATAEWSTFETIGGYMPSRDKPGTVTFVPRLITQSLIDGTWIVVDELNRADIDKAFGELFTLFGGQRVQLPYFDENGRPVTLIPAGLASDSGQSNQIVQPTDWRMLGTMNTFDKASLYQMSYAFMRRFAFVEVPIPATEDYETIISQNVSAMNLVDEDIESTILGYLTRLFCSLDVGLPSIGLSVGPAIPIDIIKFANEMIEVNRLVSHSIDVKQSLIDGVVMYLFPQFEGQDVRHVEILDTVSGVFALASDERTTLAQYLAVWTGFEQTDN